MNRRAMHPYRTFKAFARAAAPAALLLLAACGQSGTAPQDAPLAGAAIGGDFTLVDKTNKPVRYADFAGKYRIVYFGYTFCPDVCPLDVQHMMQGYHLFAKAHPNLAPQVQPLFVSIDPARDNPARVGEFAGAFGKELIGLTGTEQQVASAAKAFAVFYQKREGSSPDAYLMDHSRAAYLMGPDGKPIALLPVEKDGKSVAAELEKWIH
jgi:protein SCO1/2